MIARALALTSTVLSAAGLAWAVASWRLSGPGLRLHAVSYEGVLTVRVFNAGRQPDTLEHLVVGGTRRLIGGRDLRHHLPDLPLLLEPGRSHEFRIPADHPQLQRVSVDLRRGWASIWVLTGAMRRLRVEVLPRQEGQPGDEGWLLVARSTRFSRYLVLATATLAVACSILPTDTGRTVAVLLLLMMVFKRLVSVSPRWVFQRLRVHRVLIGLAPVVAFSSAGRMAESSAIPHLLPWVLAAYLGLCGLAAAPSGRAWIDNGLRGVRRDRKVVAREMAGGSVARAQLAQADSRLPEDDRPSERS